MSELRRTPLFDRHEAAGARFVDFGGWEMPVQYRGLLDEHAAVRTGVGLFDVSHMGEIEIAGPGALALCQQVTTNDAARLAVGRAQYTIWCAEDGGTIDDTILYRRDDEHFYFCVNASNAEACSDWIRERAPSDGSVTVTDRSAETGLIAVQGPRAADLASRLGAAWLTGLPRFGCGAGTLAGQEVFAARTGYTGEDGFELFCSSEGVGTLWDALLEAGRDHGAEPIGLGARDTLRLEAGLALYGHELSREISPLEAGLGWAVKLGKGDFLGRDALAAQKDAGAPRQLIGLALVDKGIGRAGYPVHAGGRPVGIVTSGTRSPTLRRAIALALVDREWVDASLFIEIRGREVAAERVELPFYRRSTPGRNGN